MGSAENGDFVKILCVIPLQIDEKGEICKCKKSVIEYGAKGMSGLFKNIDHKKI